MTKEGNGVNGISQSGTKKSSLEQTLVNEVSEMSEEFRSSNINK